MVMSEVTGVGPALHKLSAAVSNPYNEHIFN